MSGITIDPKPTVRVTAEPDIYREGGPHDFFLDLFAAAGAPVYRTNPASAEERLRKHTEHEQSAVELEGELARRALAGAGIQARKGTQSRALSTASTAGGEFAPPKYLTEQWASVARAACPLRDLVTRIPLPPDTTELHIPRFDTSVGVIPEVTENITPPDNYSETDSTVTKVATFAGDAFISQSLYDRGGDFSSAIVVQDFAESYGQSLASQMMTGTGSNGQILGLLNVSASSVNGVPGAFLQTYTNGSPSPQALISAIAQCAAGVSNTRERMPSAVLMRGGRWLWLASTGDGTAEVPEQRVGTGLNPTNTDIGPYGPIAGLGVWIDNTIPTNLGGGTNQDAIVVVRAKDVLLLEDPLGPRFTAYLGGTTAGELTVVPQWHHYTAVVPNRYPSAIGTVQGTGLVVPAGF